MIQLYTDSSPNGFKITIALEELNLAYQLHHVDIDKGEQHRADFLSINPHGRIPALIDDETGITLFESAAILLYLAEKTQKLLPEQPSKRWEAIKWLIFHAASVGPIIGQRVYFELFDQDKQPAPIERYRRLNREVFSTLDTHLAKHEYFADDEFSIADIAHFGWTHIARIIDFDFSDYPHLSRWHEQIALRPAVQQGITLPHPATGA
nr:glutathione S-transferase family protein [uncultured Moellerella sp.]